MIIAHVLLCVALCWMGFCRLYKSTHETPAFLRWSVAFRTAGAFWVMIDPLLRDYIPPFPVVMFLAGCLATQIALRDIWKEGAPIIR